MERVQFQQEQMLQELKDLVDKKLFTEKETKQIMKKRTVFETALVRRIAKKSDFLRYISYEMGLEQLRRKRVERMKLPPGPQTVSDYALVRRQFHIFERALRKFKSDVGLWIQYIQVAKKEGARALVGRVTARALQLHPNKPALYIIAASHELNHLSPSAARALLQRGIRMNPDSVDLWREYVRMELGFVESLRRRWDILGIKVIGDEKGKGKARDEDPSDIMGFGDGSDEKADASMEVDEVEGDEGAEARRQIMEGAIVKSVITSAAKALPKIELFESLKSVITDFPSADSLRQSLLGHLYDALRETLPDDPKAIQLLSSRFLTPDMEGEELVEGLQRANEEMLTRARDDGREDLLASYAEFVERWCRSPIDENLKLYLISCLQSLIQRTNTSPSLLSVHINLLLRFSGALSASPAKILRTARKYTDRVPASPAVWLARLEAEKQLGDGSSEGRTVVENAWRSARKSIVGSAEELERVWSWGLDQEEPPAVSLRTHEGLLKESMGDSSLRAVHEMVLMRYVTVLHEEMKVPVAGVTSDQEAKASAKWQHSIRHMAGKYLTTGRVWQKVFTVVEGTDEALWATEADGKRAVLSEVYEQWRKNDGIEATVGWAGWLMGHGKGKEATEVVMSARSWVSEGERTELEERWKGVLEEA
ncbi:U3 small nucleolar RNA-associated protein 6-domain-containing protein [Crucibulum laeve]|uniref:U3 small nucleolar RNA-associated protein 6-domain-containing protein n=1 Tax=Crucibulum laeve TaxID=68775 RepID=A0A5C3MHY3_9AGAR|nr:U3 small nucleolar RNA-associated protein 6-domain-containing protein [Crucibulum laeve]